MKNKFLLILLLIIYEQTFSQRNVLKVEYDEIVSFIPQIINNDKGTLYVSNQESFYKTSFDNIKSSEEINTNEETIVIPAKEGEYFSEIYVDLKVKKLYENLFERYALKTYYSVSEKIPEMNWKLYNEEKKISNYNCKKAETSFRGRNYVVWYTEEIPISSGPWKFNGLPGLILSVEDSQGIYKWYVKKIIYPFEEKISFDEIKKRMKKYKQITFKDLDTKIIETIKTKFETLKAREGGRNHGVIFEFSTTQWRETTNEYRKKINYIF